VTNGLFYLALFGLPIAYVTELLVFGLGYPALLRQGLTEGGWRDPFCLTVGAFSGFAAGTAFWVIGLWRSAGASSET
jgi:hypothetical protein